MTHVDETINRRGAGHFSMVPNCIFEMGLTKIEREVWSFLHRIPAWEHPVVSDMPKLLEIGKTQLMDALTKLESLNMIVVEGKGKSRIFHLPSPAYWKHHIPQRLYSFKEGENAPVNIGVGVYTGKLVNRPSQDEKKKRKRPGQDENSSPNRPSQDEKSSQPGRKNVLTRTKRNQETTSQSGVEPSLNTKQDLTILNKSPIAPFIGGGGEGEKRSIGTESIVDHLGGEMLMIYDQYAKPLVIKTVIRTMLEKATGEEILAVIERQRRTRQGLMKWDPKHMDFWIGELNRTEPEACREPDQVIEQEYRYESDEEIPYPNDCPF